jgi:hypothetical protein
MRFMVDCLKVVATDSDFWDVVGLLVVVGWLASLVIVLVASVWVIRRKGQSLWWLLLTGFLSPLWLENKKKKPEPLNS